MVLVAPWVTVIQSGKPLPFVVGPQPSWCRSTSTSNPCDVSMWTVAANEAT